MAGPLTKRPQGILMSPAPILADTHSGNSESVLHICVTTALPTELSSQPKKIIQVEQERGLILGPKKSAAERDKTSVHRMPCHPLISLPLECTCVFIHHILCASLSAQRELFFPILHIRMSFVILVSDVTSLGTPSLTFKVLQGCLGLCHTALFNFFMYDFHLQVYDLFIIDITRLLSSWNILTSVSLWVWPLAFWNLSQCQSFEN